MKAPFPGQGLALKEDPDNNEVLKVKNMAVARVQALLNNGDVTTNVTVRHTQPPGFNQPNANEDGIVVIDIVAKKNSDGTFEPTRRFSDSSDDPVVLGSATPNDLNWTRTLFGIDALGPNSGMFINRLPLIDDKRFAAPVRASLKEIANGIGNVAAHEAGHSFGMVPNSVSTMLKSEARDDRFSAVTFDGDTDYHAGSSSSSIMATESQGVTLLDNTPRILSTSLNFRKGATDAAYLKAILPK